MEKNPTHFSNAAVTDQGTSSSNNVNNKQEPEVVTETDYSYFDDLQRQPMTTEDIVKFCILVAIPSVFFIIAVVLMHKYND